MMPQEFANGLQQIYGDRLIAVLLYGSAARGDAQKKHSDANLLVVLQQCSAAALAKANPLLRRWLRKGQPPPLFFDREHIESSADVFPMEFLDILEHRKLLIGVDPFDGMTIPTIHLRHQCEHDLKGKLLHLLGTFTTHCHRTKDVRLLILESASNFFAIFRGVLRLANRAPSANRRQVAEQLKTLIEANCEILDEILDLRDGSRVWRDAEILAKFEQYLTVIRSVIRYVDQHRGTL